MHVSNRRALFLDRDGVINLDHGYVWKIADIEFVPGIFELARAARQRGFAIIVVTNQAGIGRGMYSEADFLALTGWIGARFEAEDAPIDKVYFCPAHPVHGLGRYKVDSPFRKPAPGMILQAAREFTVDLPGSVLVGDKESDIAAGRAAGVGTNVLYLPDSSPLATAGTAAPTIVTRLPDVIALLGTHTFLSP